VSSIGGCYQVVPDTLQWPAANQRCISLHPNAHQVVINSVAEQTIVSSMLFQYPGILQHILFTLSVYVLQLKTYLGPFCMPRLLKVRKINQKRNTIGSE